MRNIKKLLSLLLVVAMLCGMLIFPASAAAAGTVTVQLTGKDGQVTTLATWTYDSTNETYTDSTTNGQPLAIVTDYSSNPLVYTGLNKKQDPRCLSVTTKGIALEDLYDYAEKLAGNIDLRGDTAMGMAASTDGKTNDFTYDQYWGLDRYNYMNWYNQTTYDATFSDWTDGVKVAGTLAIKGYHATTGSNVDTLVANADSENALRISVGQQLNGNKTIEDSWVHTGNNGGAGDINEGNLSLKNIGLIKFTPNYKTITVTDGTAAGTEGADDYSVTANNATVTTGDNWFKAAKDEKVTLTVTAAEGYQVKSVAVTGTEAVTVTDNENGTYTFTMPGEAVTVAVETEAAAAAQSPVTMTAGAIVDGKFDLTITVNGEPCTGASFATVSAYFSADEGLSLGSAFSAYQGSTQLSSAVYQLVPATGKHQYTLSANGATGEDLIFVIPVTVADSAQPGTYTITMEPAQKVSDEVCYGMSMSSTYTMTALYPEVGTVTTTVTVEAVAQPVAPSIITTAAELKLLADEVNAGDDKAGETYTLGADIDLSAYTNWTPIGQATVSESGTLTLGNAFAGTFDGNDKTISGLSASNANGGVALFGYSTGTIKDLTVSGAVSGNLYTAGVVAVGQGTISGVTSNVNVTLGASGQYVGGILGEANGTVSITDCHNTGTLTNGGGSADISTGKVGGIVGRVDTGISATITNCSNTGAITAYQYVGGIIGGAFGNVEIKGCCNSGTLTAISFGKTYLGGIAGKLKGGTIDSCYNVGTLNSTPWGNGHIRAVGGIAGCEEDHAEGTAITNCYNVGTINLDTSKMQSGKQIYLVGAISGGNDSDGNTMGYEDCFYLAGCIPSQNSEHESYQWWNASWKSNNALYDTANVLAKTEAELKGADVLAALGNSFKAVEGGYPVLTWQDGTAVPPTLQSYAVTGNVTGGTATVNVDATAQEQSTVSFTVTGIENGKQIKTVAVTDAAGTPVTVSENGGTYSFTMPSRAVTIAVTLENVVAEGAGSYAITLPTGLDPIWTLSVDSSGYEAGTVTEGSTVTVKVAKDEKALGTSFTGITVTGASGNVDVTAGNVQEKNGSNYYGEYSFTMPGEAVEVTLNATYADLKVYVKEGEEDAELTKTLTRADMVELSAENSGTAYYSGWRTESEAFIGVAEQYVTLTQLLTNAGITLEEGDSITVSTPDNFEQPYTYAQLTAERKYYSDILTNGANATEGTAFPYTLVIKGNTVSDADDLNTVVCDTLYTYRFVYGQTTAELTGKVKCVDSMPQCVTSVTVNKAEQTSTGTGWDGTADTSWYNDTDTTFTITTAAQLAGLAQLVDEGNDFAGKTVKLGNDIALNEEGSTANSWNPIGSAAYAEYDTGISSDYGATAVGVAASGSKAFAGTFDGQNYEITGLYISSSESGQGLFANNAGTIKNLTVNGAIAKAGSDYVGSIAGFNSGTIADVVSNVTINVSSSNVGGIAGYNDGYMEGSVGLIIRCGNNAAVTGAKKVGGIAGESTGTIKYCYNKGSILGTADAKNGVGGIVGRNGCNGGAINTSKVEDCYNAGSVGVNCKWTGGITGFLNPGATISNSLVVAFATSGASSRNNPIAGNVDDQNAGFVTNVYSLQGLTKSGSWYQEVGTIKTADELKDASFPAQLGGAFVAGGDMNNGYPVLFWEKGLTMGTISVDKNIEFGEVTCAATAATETNTVTVTVKAEKNYALKEGSLKYTTDGETYTALTATSTEGEYTFTMPKGDVTITAEFSYTGTYWDGTIDTAWYNTTDTVFIINTPAELAGFAAIVNGTASGIEKDNFSGKTVQLGTNIALGEDGLYETVANVTYGNTSFPMTTTQYYLKEAAPVWTPIGSGSATSNTNASGNVFAGTFDGKGYTISGVYTGSKDSTTGNTATVQGLFGIVTGTVQNVTVTGCITGKIVVGGVVAHLNGGTVQNCTNKAIIFADGGTTPAGNVENGVDRGGAVGGIVGNAMTGSTVTKCVNNATVINANTCYGGRTGGIVGLIDGKDDDVTVSKCGNTGNIETYQYGGGIVGLQYSKVSVIDQCYNTGDVYGHGTQKIHFGGIVGTYTGTISNCYNTGTIIQTRTDNSKANYYGGIGGDYNYDVGSGTIINCYNLGEIVIKSTYGSHSAGMISGEGKTTTNCYYLGTLSTSKMGGTHGTAKTEAELKDAAFLTAINVENQGAFVSDSSTDPVNNGYPVLGWQLGVEDPIPVSTKSEGEFVSEYVENQKFSIGTFKIYTVYNNDSTTELKEYEVYLDGTKIDTASYTFTMDDSEKTLKVTWTANGTETNFVEKTLGITADSLNGSFAGNSGSPKLGTYFAGETLDVSALTKVMYYLTSGGRMTVEGEELADLKWSLKVGEETVLTFDADFTSQLTADHNGAKLIMSFTWREKTVDKDWGALTVLENKDPNAEGYYELSTADDVVWFSAKVASGATDINAILKNDIDLTGVSLSAMSNYAGTFDGNGKTLTVKAALFNSVSTGTVKNLTVTGTFKGHGVGGVVNTINGAATIENCVNKCNITADGYTRTGTIGGIVSTITADAAGAKITKCVNEGTISITANYATNAGGIVAKVDCADVEISQCVNTGAVKVTAIFATTAGGIAAVSKAKITDCYNTATVSASGIRGSTAGGIVGSNSGTIANCYSIGTASSQTAPSGAIAGTNSGTVTNSYALTGTNGVLANGSGTIDEASAFKTEDELKAEAMPELLGTWFVADDSTTPLNNGYPVLYWQKGLGKCTVTIAGGITNGTVTVDKLEAPQGTVITVTVTPAENYALKTNSLTYTPIGGTATVITANEGVYSFNAPATDVTITAVFESTDSDNPGGSTPTGPDTSDMDLTSATWDGISVDVSWYVGNQNAASYTISTAAQFAGVAALVNGLVNEDCLVYDGETVSAANEWNISEYVFNDSGVSGSNNQATANYYYGITRFNGQTINITTDLNMSVGNWMPIGGSYLMTDENTATKVSGSFCGVLDGMGHNITIACDRHCSGNYGDGANIGLIGRLGVNDGDPAGWQPSGAAVCNLAVYGSVKGNRSVGGIVGKIGETADAAVIENCANFATITGTDAKGTGGIVGAGWNNGMVKNCYNAGSVTLTMANNAVGGISGSNEIKLVNCYNIGVVTANGSSAAIATENGGGTYENCYWLTGTANVGVYNSTSTEVVEKTANEMKSEEFVLLLGSDVFNQDASASINSGYPVLKWQGGKVVTNANSGSGGTASGNTSTEQAETNTTVENGKATVTVDSEVLTETLKNATEDTQIVISADIPEGETVAEVTAELSASDVAAVAENGASLQVTTPIADVMLSNEALKDITAEKGESVTVTAESDKNTGAITIEVAVDGKALDEVSGGVVVNIPAESVGTGGVLVIVDEDGTETIVKKSAVGEDSVAALLDGSATVRVVDNSKNFSDTDGHWGESAIDYVTSRELFNGVGGDTFAPNGTMTRAMLATVLHRLEDEIEHTYDGFFHDVEDGQWYTEAIHWAAENKIVEGYGENIFGAVDNLTREQMATMLYRYAKYLDMDVMVSDSLSSFPDGNDVSDWAKTAVQWAVGSGIIGGRDTGDIDPQGHATRAEVATMLQRLITLMVK